MESNFSHNFRVVNAERFIEYITDATEGDRLYVSIGRPNGWANDAAPPTANASIDSTNEVWRYMVAAKRVFGNDIRHVIPRYDWAANTVYSAYDNATPSADIYAENNQFYVLTDEWNVYKCLANNYGALSTVKPTSTLTTGSVETADKYIWKYLYTLSAEERLRFMTTDFMPIRTLVADNGSLQWQVQDNAVDGGIEAVLVVGGGSNYTNANTITIGIAGDGSGAAAIARINTSTNVISSIVITNPGTGYTYATVSIADSGSGTGATARAIISPEGGHGSNPLFELGGSYVMMNPRIRGTEDEKIPVDNEYRQIALIKNPLLNGTSNIASNTVHSQFTTLTLDTGSTSYVEDEQVYQGISLEASTFSGTVASWDDSNNIIKLVNVIGTPLTDVLNGETSRAARLVQSVTNRELSPFSGEILYISNFPPIQRAADQTEDFKIVIKF